MKMNDILSSIRELAMSQDFYGRLYRSLMEIKNTNPEQYEEITETLEAQNFTNTLSMVLFFEC